MHPAQIYSDFYFDPPRFLSEPSPKRARLSSSDSQDSAPTTSTPASASSLPPSSLPSIPPLATSLPNHLFPLTSVTTLSAEAAPADKRLRNNQASARFRAKKKLREMQVENTARDAIVRAEVL